MSSRDSLREYVRRVTKRYSLSTRRAICLAVLELCRARVLHLAGSQTDCTVRTERDDLPEDLSF